MKSQFQNSQHLIYQLDDVVMVKCENSCAWPAYISAFRGFSGETGRQLYMIKFIKSDGSWAFIDDKHLILLSFSHIRDIKAQSKGNKNLIAALNEAEKLINKLKDRLAGEMMVRFQKLYLAQSVLDWTFLKSYEASMQIKTNHQSIKKNYNKMFDLLEMYKQRKNLRYPIQQQQLPLDINEQQIINDYDDKIERQKQDKGQIPESYIKLQQDKMRKIFKNMNGCLINVKDPFSQAAQMLVQKQIQVKQAVKFIVENYSLKNAIRKSLINQMVNFIELINALKYPKLLLNNPVQLKRLAPSIQALKKIPVISLSEFIMNLLNKWHQKLQNTSVVAAPTPNIFGMDKSNSNGLMIKLIQNSKLKYSELMRPLLQFLV